MSWDPLVGQLQGWFIRDNKLAKDWSITLSSNTCMVNTIAATDERIFTGCGDHQIYGFDAESHKQIHRLNEHKDYVNCIELSADGHMLYSGGEDGAVLVWDLRCGQKSVSQIYPHRTGDLSRPTYGKWIGALTLATNNWLICGGGPHLAVWHLNTMSYSTKFDAQSTANVVVAHNDYYISGGSDSSLHFWELNGELKSTIPTSAPDVFSISAHHYKDSEFGIKELISGAGMSYKVDICANWKYKDFSLLVY
jgi:THO complex subunit 6